MGVGGRMDFCSQLVKYGMFISNFIIFVSRLHYWRYVGSIELANCWKLVLTLRTTLYRSAEQLCLCWELSHSSIETSWVNSWARTCSPEPFMCWSLPRPWSAFYPSSDASELFVKSNACCWRWVNQSCAWKSCAARQLLLKFRLCNAETSRRCSFQTPSSANTVLLLFAQFCFLFRSPFSYTIQLTSLLAFCSSVVVLPRPWPWITNTFTLVLFTTSCREPCRFTPIMIRWFHWRWQWPQFGF